MIFNLIVGARLGQVGFKVKLDKVIDLDKKGLAVVFFDKQGVGKPAEARTQWDDVASSAGLVEAVALGGDIQTKPVGRDGGAAIHTAVGDL